MVTEVVNTQMMYGTLDGKNGKIRIQFRWEDGDKAFAWINRNRQLDLNETGAFMTQLLLEQADARGVIVLESTKPAVVRAVINRYEGVSEDQVKKDLCLLIKRYSAIAAGRCPTHDLHLPTHDPQMKTWRAPMRMDLAVTYLCNNDCKFCYMGGSKRIEELTLDQWKQVIDKIRAAGVPMLTFSGGEPTLRKDLPEIVSYAKGFSTGLITNGRQLTKVAEPLREAGLDHIQVSLESADPAIHDSMVCASGAWEQAVAGIRAAREAGIGVATNTTLTLENYEGFLDLLRFGREELGLTRMACNSLICSGKVSAKKENGLDPAILKGVLAEAVSLARSLGMTFTWYSPTCYEDINPLELNLGIKCCSAAQANMTVEPNGNVIPCQSWIHQNCGNILVNSWDSIWNHPICTMLRTKAYHPHVQCKGCGHWETCGGGCPLDVISQNGGTGKLLVD